jgi:hypothetical protein
MVTDEIERRNAVVIAGDSFAVDDAGARAQACQGLDNQREAMGEIIAGTAVEPHPLAVLAGNDAEAVVLDLMQPQCGYRLVVWRIGSGMGGQHSRISPRPGRSRLRRRPQFRLI